jgi:hypothetical protein
MVTRTKRRRLFKGDQDLFKFGRAYLSEAFPNPERKGCPPDKALRLLASRPTQGDPSITDHVTCCSPCFNVYMAHLEHARAEANESRRMGRARWVKWSVVSAGVAAMLAISIYLSVIKRQSAPAVGQRPPTPISKPGTPTQMSATAKYLPVLVDFSTSGPGRGISQGPPTHSAQVVPASQFVELTLQLPIGSEAAIYSVKLKSKMRTEWASTGRAHLESGQPLLRIRADFSHIPPGQHDLVVASKGLHLSVPVMLKSTQTNNQ